MKRPGLRRLIGRAAAIRLVGILLTVLHLNAVAGSECGFPGAPANGSVTTKDDVSPEGTQVKYVCEPGYVLFGDLQRTCQANNTWSGEVPTCDLNLAKGKKASQSNTFYKYLANQAVDGLVETCSFTPKSTDRRWWQVQLGANYNIAAVSVTISPGILHKFSVFVVSHLRGGKLSYDSCSTFEGVFESDTVMLLCNHGGGQRGSMIFVRDDRSVPENFGLCEIEVFQRRDHHPCGDPELPVFGHSKLIGPGILEYHCAIGYRLNEQGRRICTEGRWSGSIPTCLPVVCPTPREMDNGIIQVFTAYDQFLAGTIANYTCDEGYLLVGPSSRICTLDGTWSGQNPQCQLIKCGSPPWVSNGTVLYNSTVWGTPLQIVCDEGFKLIGDSESVCGTDGTWEKFNATCQEVPLTFPIEQQTETPLTEVEEPMTASPPTTDDYELVLLATEITLLSLPSSVSPPTENTTENENSTSSQPLLKATGINLLSANDDRFFTPYREEIGEESAMIKGIVTGSIVAIVVTLFSIAVVAYLRKRWLLRAVKGCTKESMKQVENGTRSHSNLVDGQQEYDDISYSNSGFSGEGSNATTPNTVHRGRGLDGDDSFYMDDGGAMSRIYDNPAADEPIYYTPVEFEEARSSGPVYSNTLMKSSQSRRSEDDVDNTLYEPLDPGRLDKIIYAKIDKDKKKRDREESFRRSRENAAKVERRSNGSFLDDGVYENVAFEDGSMCASDGEHTYDDPALDLPGALIVVHRPLPPIPSESDLGSSIGVDLVEDETMDNDIYSSVPPEERRESQDDSNWENSESIYAALDIFQKDSEQGDEVAGEEKKTTPPNT